MTAATAYWFVYALVITICFLVSIFKRDEISKLAQLYLDGWRDDAKRHENAIDYYQKNLLAERKRLQTAWETTNDLKKHVEEYLDKLAAAHAEVSRLQALLIESKAQIDEAREVLNRPEVSNARVEEKK
ncbi:MAG: hypothetical protein KGL39_47115 [Patescibacteria group bacterium]|nr:hypothetical protein [Patescibacteria group bacterium]